MLGLKVLTVGQMEVIKLIHNTPEWLEFRKSGIGGSDAAAICGVSPFKTNVEVWEEKMGLREPADLSDSPQVQYGKDAEDLQLKLFALDFPEYDVASHKDIVYKRDFMFASLDGELVCKSTQEEGIYEGKTTEVHSNRDLEKWNNKIPTYYYCQVLHYLIVTDRKFAILRAQIKHEGQNGEIELITRHYKFNRKDCLNDMKYLYMKEKQFWKYVTTKTRPPLILPSIA